MSRVCCKNNIPERDSHFFFLGEHFIIYASDNHYILAIGDWLLYSYGWLDCRRRFWMREYPFKDVEVE